MAFVLAPYYDNRRLMNAAIPIDSTDIFVKDLWETTRLCCLINDTMPGYRKALLKYNNIPRQMRLCCAEGKLSLDLTGFRDQRSINNSDVSFSDSRSQHVKKSHGGT